MKVISTNHFFLHNWTHGYYAAKNHFDGKFVREVLITFYDVEKKYASRGYMFVNEKNTLIYLVDYYEGDNFTGPALLELESSDKLTLQNDATKYLKEMINQSASGEYNLNVETTNPAALVVLNDKQFILPGIHADIEYGKRVINDLTLFYVPKDDFERTENLTKLINSSVNAQPMQEYTKIEGLSAGVATAQIYGATIATVLILLGTIIFFVLLFKFGPAVLD